jgi:hypothetical protein
MYPDEAFRQAASAAGPSPCLAAGSFWHYQIGRFTHAEVPGDPAVLATPLTVHSVTTSNGKRRLEFEQLESRELPAALAFLSPAAVYGAASLSGATTANVKSLLAFHSGDLARKISDSSQAFSSLRNYSDASSYRDVAIATSAYTAGSTVSSAYGIARTTTGNGYNSVTVQVVASSYAEAQGQVVLVTLTPRFVSTIGLFNRGSASNSYSFYVNGQQVLGGTATARTTNTYSRTITFQTTIGSTFRIAFQSQSHAGFAGNGKSNTAKMEFSLGMAVSTLGGGGGGSTGSGGGSTGGGTGSTFAPPAAPSTPTWSSAGGKDIYLRWNDVAGETSYRVEYWNRNTGQWAYLGTPGANVTSVKIFNGLGFYFRVGATNSFGTNFSAFVLAQ